MNRYQIVSELGKGATGVVYRAVRVEDGSTVALKKLVLPGHLDAKQEEEFVQRFKTEAEAALSIKHPGVVRALDCGLDDGTFYIAYELVDGVTLEEAIRSGRKFSPEEVTDIVLQAADALGFAHGLGVIHRDISPGNIFITRDGKVKIADFGVAKFTGRAEGSDQAIVGTPGYMSPEQITGGTIDARSDVFSIGCVAYELLTGRPPFTGDNIAQIIHQVLHSQPPSVREANTKVPITLSEMVNRAISKNPGYRYQTMAELKAKAERILGVMPRDEKVPTVDEAGHGPSLVVVEGKNKGARFDLLPTVTTIGRVVGDILLPDDSEIANQHAWITQEGSTWVLFDADTKSGTFVNDEQISREEILAGDRVKIGNTVLEFRGAGGQAGVFKEAVPPPPKEIPKAVEAALEKHSSPIGLVLLSIGGLLAIAAVVVYCFVIPAIYTRALDTVTDPRWKWGFSILDEAPVGSPIWLDPALEVLDGWRNDPLTEPSEFYAPDWVYGAERIKNDADYRFHLFELAERFLSYATGESVTDTQGVQSMATGYTGVSALEPLVEGLVVPRGESRIWIGRKNQLLGLIRNWKAASGSGSNQGQSPLGFPAEREQAKTNLLNGWYLYKEPSRNFQTMEEAFNQFQMCRQTLTAILDARPKEPDASAERALAAFLAARVLRDVGSADAPDRWERAMAILDEAETDVANSDAFAWGRAIPTCWGVPATGRSSST
jgi:serine/threonine protein kinase